MTKIVDHASLFFAAVCGICLALATCGCDGAPMDEDPIVDEMPEELPEDEPGEWDDYEWPEGVQPYPICEECEPTTCGLPPHRVWDPCTTHPNR
jgi:hypothetical protein